MSRCKSNTYRTNGGCTLKTLSFVYKKIIHIDSRTVRLISQCLPDKEKFAENFGEFLMHLLFGAARGDEGLSADFRISNSLGIMIGIVRLDDAFLVSLPIFCGGSNPVREGLLKMTLLCFHPVVQSAEKRQRELSNMLKKR